MPTGYRVEVAKTAQAKCNGQQPCKGTKIGKGELRVGTWVEFQGHGTFKWRHWGCTTEKVLHNMKETFDEASEVDGYDEIPPVFQAKLNEAWKVGHVAAEDIPESAKKPDEPAESGEDGGSSPVKKKKAPKTKDENGEEDEENLQMKKAPTRKAKDEDEQGQPKKVAKKMQAKKGKEASEYDEVDVKPKKTKRASAKKVKEEEEDDEEDEKPPKKTASKRAKAKPGSDEEADEKPPSKKAKSTKVKNSKPESTGDKIARPARASKPKKKLTEEDDGENDGD